jgi:hypothetical protein
MRIKTVCLNSCPLPPLFEFASFVNMPLTIQVVAESLPLSDASDRLTLVLEVGAARQYCEMAKMEFREATRLIISQVEKVTGFPVLVKGGPALQTLAAVALARKDQSLPSIAFPGTGADSQDWSILSGNGEVQFLQAGRAPCQTCRLSFYPLAPWRMATPT